MSYLYNYIDEELHIALARKIGDRIGIWIRDQDDAELVVTDFKEWMDTSPQRLRQEITSAGDMKVTTDTAVSGSGDGVDILPIGVNADGTLVVRFIASGREKVLVADYLY